MRMMTRSKHRQPARKLISVLVVGLYLLVFAIQGATAFASGDHCGEICCCKEASRHLLTPSIASPMDGCCSSRPVPSCNIQDGIPGGFPDTALQVTAAPGKRLSSDTNGVDLNPGAQQMPTRSWFRAVLGPNLRLKPLYLETGCLLR